MQVVVLLWGSNVVRESWEVVREVQLWLHKVVSKHPFHYACHTEEIEALRKRWFSKSCCRVLLIEWAACDCLRKSCRSHTADTCDKRNGNIENELFTAGFVPLESFCALEDS
jgi:hypothetical protein